MLDDESRFSVEENVACSCFSREGRLEALQLGFTPTSRSSNTSDKRHDQLKNEKILQVTENKC